MESRQISLDSLILSFLQVPALPTARALARAMNTFYGPNEFTVVIEPGSDYGTTRILIGLTQTFPDGLSLTLSMSTGGVTSNFGMLSRDSWTAQRERLASELSSTAQRLLSLRERLTDSIQSTPPAELVASSDSSPTTLSSTSGCPERTTSTGDGEVTSEDIGLGRSKKAPSLSATDLRPSDQDIPF
jgi:hypothetical protein